MKYLVDVNWIRDTSTICVLLPLISGYDFVGNIIYKEIK